jgi:hypothetical protein
MHEWVNEVHFSRVKSTREWAGLSRAGPLGECVGR